MSKIRNPEFYIDSEDLSQDEKTRLGTALCGLAEGDTPFSVEVILTDEEEIRRLNREQRGIDRVTDVLSFPAMDVEKGEPISARLHGECLETIPENGKEEDRLCLGSVVICKKRAADQAEEYGHSFARELNYLAVHGILHCLGYDHETDADKEEMREKEEAIMKKMGLSREN